jgi:hypothetical protein
MSNDDSSGAYGVSPDEPKAKSASGRGFKSHLPHHSATTGTSAVTADIIAYG